MPFGTLLVQGLVRAAALVAVAVAGCGGAPRGTPAAPGPHIAVATPADAAWLAGHWRWTHASTEGTVHRVEVEDWWLEADGALLTGRYARRVLAFSLDGVPFQCNQRLSYELTTTYRLRGRAAAGGADLSEVDALAGASPCDGGHRAVTRYRAEPAAGGAAVLHWKDGRQTLRRSAAPVAGAPAVATPGIGGTWRWSNRTVDARGNTRVELETWMIDQTGDALEGAYQRRVTIFAEDGRVYPCNGQPVIDYTDRFRFEGSLSGSLVETAATPADHPCTSRERHLDAATVSRHGNPTRFLELTWRGRNRQVLARAD